MRQWLDDTTSIDSSESFPILHATPQENCRKSRPINHAAKWGYVKQTLSYILRFLFWSSGYNRHVAFTSKLYSCVLFLLCCYQVVYEIYKTSGCIDFNCHENATVITTTRRFEYTSHLFSALGSCSSYGCMLICLNAMYKKSSNAISPYKALRDMGNSKARIILWSWVVLSIIYVGYILLYIYIRTTNPTYDVTFSQRAIRYFSDITAFLTQWVAIVSLFAFSCSTFAIGKVF